MDKVQKSIVLTGFALAITTIFLFTLGSIVVYAQQKNTPIETQSLDILSHKIKEGQFSDKLIGQLQNNLNDKVQSVEVIATFYDQAGDIVGTKNGFTNPTDLSAGMKAPFDLYLDEGITDELASYDLTVSWRLPGNFEEQNKVFEFSKQQPVEESQIDMGEEEEKEEEEEEENEKD
jgi:hypothetical protein